jgi:hypothetical protein
MKYLGTQANCHQYEFVCPVCEFEAEMSVPIDWYRPFDCPGGCGATYVQRLHSFHPVLFHMGRHTSTTRDTRRTKNVMRAHSVPIRPAICPPCGNEIEWVNHTDGTADGMNVPQVGDLAVCAYCGHVSVFLGDLSLRPLTEREWREIPSHVEQQIAATRQLAAGMLSDMP